MFMVAFHVYDTLLYDIRYELVFPRIKGTINWEKTCVVYIFFGSKWHKYTSNGEVLVFFFNFISAETKLGQEY